MKNFRDKVVVITGAGSGIGRAVALAFAKEGARVHVVDLERARSESVADEIRSAGGRAIPHQVDCRSRTEIEALADELWASEGRVDILHNNAGIGHGGRIEQTTLEDWDRVLSINLWGTIIGIQTFVPRMLRQGGEAHLINTASGLGLVAAPGMAPYCASKFAVVGISESLTSELAPKGIGVTVLCPGIINTAIVDAARLAGRSDNLRDKIRALYRERGASAESVAADLLAGVRANAPVVITPKSQVGPLWALKRSSLTAYLKVAQAFGTRILGQ